MKIKIVKVIIIAFILIAWLSLILIAELKYDVPSIVCSVIGGVFGFIFRYKIIPYIWEI